MPYLTLNGVTVNVPEGGKRTPIRLGQFHEAFDGTPRRIVSGSKLQWEFSTGILSGKETTALEAIIDGRGDSWTFNDGTTYSSKGERLQSGTASVTSDSNRVNFINVTAPGTWNLIDVGADWTLLALEGTSGTWHRWITTSEPTTWMDGVATAEPDWCSISAGTLTLDIGKYDSIWVLPVTVPVSLYPMLDAFLASSALPESPGLVLGGDIHPTTLSVTGAVTERQVLGAMIDGSWDPAASVLNFQLREA